MAKRRQTQTRAGAASTLIGSCVCGAVVARFVGLIGWRAESPGALCGIVVASLTTQDDGAGAGAREREAAGRGWEHVREPCENGGFPTQQPTRFPTFFLFSHTARGVTDVNARDGRESAFPERSGNSPPFSVPTQTYQTLSNMVFLTHVVVVCPACPIHIHIHIHIHNDSHDHGQRQHQHLISTSTDSAWHYCPYSYSLACHFVTYLFGPLSYAHVCLGFLPSFSLSLTPQEHPNQVFLYIQSFIYGGHLVVPATAAAAAVAATAAAAVVAATAAVAAAMAAAAAAVTAAVAAAPAAVSRSGSSSCGGSDRGSSSSDSGSSSGNSSGGGGGSTCLLPFLSFSFSFSFPCLRLYLHLHFHLSRPTSRPSPLFFICLLFCLTSRANDV